MQLLLGEQPGLDGLGQFDLILGGQQRYPPDLAQVDADEVAGDRAACLLGLLGPGRGFGVLVGGVHYLDAFGREHPHDAVEFLGRQVAGVDGDRDVPDSHGPLFSGPC